MNDSIRFEYYGSVGSTNELAKQRALAGEPSGLCIIASEQTAGKGRMGRTFISPAGNGLYMSLMLRPDLKVAELLQVTAMAASEVAAVIEDFTESRAEIKWVNDILVAGKKVCGILTECGFDGEKLSYIIVGIGINTGSAEIKAENAGSICLPEGKDIKQMAMLIAHDIAEGVPVLKKGYYLPAYRSRCSLIGKDIIVIRGDSRREARALAVTDSAFLLVEYPDGRTEELSSFEVSVR